VITAPDRVVALRPYQIDAVESILNSFSDHDKNLAVMPTGSGKTIVFAEIANRLRPRKTLILAHREELIDQAVDKIRKVSGAVTIGIEKAERTANLTDDIVVASVQSMLRRPDKFPMSHFGLIVCDEAHHALSDSWQSVLDRFSSCWVLGVTATPDRGDKRDLGGYFDNIAYELGIFELIKSGYLSNISVQSVPINLDLRGKVRTTAGDFNSSDLDCALTPYLQQIADAMQEHCQDRKTLVFLPLIETSKRFTQILTDKGMNAEHIDGTSEDRKEILARFDKAKKPSVLCNAMLLTEGYDCPSVDCIVVLRPTRSRPLYAQMVGRGTRVDKGKKNLLLLDFLWMHERHALCRPSHLIAPTTDIAEDITRLSASALGQVDLISMMETATAQREETLRRELAKNANKKAKVIDISDYALSLHRLDLADFECSMRWHDEPVTTQQVELLFRFGIDTSSVRCRGQASALLDVIIKRSKMGLATPKQVKWLKRMGYNKPEEATFEQASRWLEQRWGKK